jgi:hypothetical protein
MEGSTNEQLQYELEVATGQTFPPATPYQLLREKLGLYLNHLIMYDQHKLIFILYRVDLSEQRVKQLLQQQHDNAGLLIADLLIERQLQKIQLRQQFRQEDSAIPEEDKW